MKFPWLLSLCWLVWAGTLAAAEPSLGNWPSALMLVVFMR